jgi:serine/threonine-protein kinase RsbW
VTNHKTLNPVRISTLRPEQARTILLEIPAEREQVLLVRSLTGHIAARTDLTLVDLGDLRLAVDEACGLFLLDARFDATDRALRCRFEERPGLLRIQISAPVPPGMRPDLHDIGWIMLGALMDEVSWCTADGIGTITLVKRLTAVDAR